MEIPGGEQLTYNMNGKKVLITGITGFMGHHLASYIQQTYPDCVVTGISRNRSQIPQNAKVYSVDLLQPEQLLETIDQIKPDYVFHLAALVLSYNWNDLYNHNVIATLNLLEAIRKAKLSSRIIMTGTAAEYGVVSSENLPVTEAYNPEPQTPYGMTKLWQTFIGRYYSTETTPVIVARIFNIIGHGTAQQISTGDLFKQINGILENKQESRIWVGNLNIKRDFLDIDDVCAGLIEIALRGKPSNLYNVCSGFSKTLKEILELSISISGIKVEIVVDKNKSQNTYVKDIYGCNKKIKNDTQWQPVVTIEDSIRKALIS